MLSFLISKPPSALLVVPLPARILAGRTFIIQRVFNGQPKEKPMIGITMNIPGTIVADRASPQINIVIGFSIGMLLTVVLVVVGK